MNYNIIKKEKIIEKNNVNHKVKNLDGYSQKSDHNFLSCYLFSVEGFFEVLYFK